MDQASADRRAPVAPTARSGSAPAGGSPGLIALQRAAGNQAVAVLVRQLQRCGGETHPGCPCAGDGHAHGEEVGAAGPVPHSALQRRAEEPRVVQREGEKDPADLTGTPFENLDEKLKTVLKDKSIFTWTKPTLAETLNDMSNADLAILARIGSMISSTASFLWPYVKRLASGGWITDNFGMRVEWTDGAGLGAVLAGRKDFCKDNPLTARYYHGTTNAYRQIGKPGAATMHVITQGSTEVHIDVHQPVESKEDEDSVFAGQCNYDLGAWMSHAGDVTSGGGGSGAGTTAIARYAKAKDGINRARRADYYRKEADEPPLVEAEQNLKTIEMAVQRYAALGKMVDNEWEGDKQMLADPKTMEPLKRAEALIRQVDIAQVDRRPDDYPVGP